MAAEGTLSPDTELNHDRYIKLGGERRDCVGKVTAKMRHLIGHAHVVVDALFGTGLSRPIEGVAAELIELANSKDHALRVAVDVPSGINASTGQVMGTAFRAAATTTYGLEKVGLHQYPGRSYAGIVYRVSIGLPASVVDDVGAGVRWMDEQAAACRVPKRFAAGHKGTYGHVAIIGGFTGKEGAGVLAARGALHAGAGRVTWFRRPSR